MHLLGPRVPNFRLLRSTTCCFKDITHFMIFQLTAMLKFQSATKYLKLGQLTRKVTDSSTMVAVPPW